MSFHSFLGNAFFQWRKPKRLAISRRSSLPRPLTRRPTVEILEDRLCPSGNWVAEAPMLTPRSDLGVGVVGGILYALGGAQPGSTFLATNEAYNPTTNAWQTEAPMQTPRLQFGVGVVNGILYAVGGYTGGETATVEAYDPASNFWTFKAPLPTGPGRPANAVGVVNGILYAVVPFLDSSPGQHLEAYNPATNTWTVLGTMPSGVGSGDAVGVVNGILYVVGGNDSNAPAGTVEAYDPGTNTWTAKAPMPTPREHLSVGVVNGILYAVGGDGYGGVLATVEAYDPATNTWTTEAPMPTARTELAAGVVNGVLYALGGVNNVSGYLATNEAFTPNQQPVANDFSVTLTTTAGTIPVLANASDPDGDTVTVSAVTQGANGTVTINNDGTVTYALTRFFSGTDSFTYTVSDGRGGMATGTVTVQVQVPPSQGITLVSTQVANLNLNNGQINSLSSKLDAAQQSLSSGNNNAAANQLGAFINQVRALKNSGQLDPGIADFLIAEIQTAIDLL